MEKVAPLNASFMIGSLLGVLLSWAYVYPKSNSFGFAFFLVFMIMFVASLISMLRASPEALLYADEQHQRDDQTYSQLLDAMAEDSVVREKK